MKENVEELVLIAINAAMSAGEILKKGFYSQFKINNKEGRHNLVTEYDILSEKHIIKCISEKFPSHTFLCEESGYSSKQTEEIQWIIDPLDGTVNFAHRIPIFGVSISARKKDDVLLGVTYQPMTNELFVAQKNKGSFLNGRKISVSNVKDINDGMIGTGFPYNLIENPDHCIERFLNMVKLGVSIRRLGAATLDFAYLACGRLDGFWETNLGPWDCAAGLLLVREAGGQVTRWDGDTYKVTEKNQVLASNKHIHNQLIREFSNK